MNFNPLKQPPLPGKSSGYRRFIFYWLPLILFCGAILWQSSLPSSSNPQLFRHEDKLEHMAAFGLLAWLLARALKGYSPLGNGTVKWAVVAFACIFGLSDEFYQYFVPTRTASLADFTADIVGSLIGVWIYLDIYRAGK